MRQALVSQLKEWRNQGEKLILLIDSNENMSGGPLARMLTHPDLAMIDAVHHLTQLDGPHAFVRGSCQIDGAWVTPDIDI